MLTKSQRYVASVLARGSRMIRAIRGGTEASDYEGALKALKALSHEEGIPIALIGGAATIHHGYPRSTKDIDIVVSVKDFERILKVAYQYNIKIDSYNPTGFHELSYRGIPIEVIQEGAFGHHESDPASIPSPSHLGVEKGLGFASLPTWVRMKLSGDRRKDYADIVEVLKKTSPEKVSEVSHYLQGFNQDYYRKFQGLYREAEAESVVS